jgi:hypothetical protein
MKKTNTSRKINLLIFLCLIFSLNSFGQILPEWVDTIGGPAPFYTSPVDMKVDANGNTYVGGLKADTLGNQFLELAKYNSSGIRLFTIDTALYSYSYQMSVLIDDSMNLYAAVVDTSPNQILVLKYDINGNLIWSSTNTSLSPYRFTDPIEAVIDRDRNIYIVGEGDSVPDYQNHDIITMKFNSSGVYQWSARYHSFNNGDFVYLGLDSLLNVYVTGNTSNDLVLLKYDASGNKLWTRIFGNAANDQSPTSVAVTNSGTCYIGGQYRQGIDIDYLLLKYDSSGNLKWYSVDSITTGSDDRLMKIKLDSTENIYITGITQGLGSSGSSYYTMKYDSSGNILWAKPGHHSLPGGVVLATLCLDNLNNVFVTGKSANTSTGYWDIFSIKYDTNGDSLWEAAFTYCPQSNLEVYKCSCDPANNVYLSGLIYLQNIISTSKITLKYGSTVNVEELVSNNDFMPYPNPTNSILNLFVNRKESIIITNLLGEIVLQETGEGKVELDVSFFSTGLYFIKAGNEMRKFVKE